MSAAFSPDVVTEAIANGPTDEREATLAPPIRILLMEDDEGLARLCQLRLTRAGYVVDWAPDGEQGLARYDARAHDVVLLDHTMPVYDGLEVLRRLAAQGPLPPVVMVTGAGNEQLAVEAMRLGARDYLIKDVDAGYLELLPAVVARVLRQQRAEEHMRLALTVFESVAEAIVVTDAQTRIVSVNQAFTAITGYTAEEAAGRRLSFLRSERHDNEFYQQLWDTLERTGRWQGDLWDRTKDGRDVPVGLTISAVRDGRGLLTNYVGVLADISFRKQAEERLRHSATHDPLTGLPNRDLFQDRMQQALAAARRSGQLVAVALLDLDHFKQVNDSFGHACGDLVLQEVAGRLVRAVRECDTVARLGGDEFILLLPDLSCPDDASAIADRALRALTEPILLDGRPHNASASMGISLFPTHGEEEQVLLKNADAAMYRAKQRHNSYEFWAVPSAHEQEQRPIPAAADDQAAPEHSAGANRWQTPMDSSPMHTAVRTLEAQVGALSELLSVQERVVSEQTEKLIQSALDLQRANTEVKLLADNIADVLWVQDLEGRFTYVSPSVTRQRGYLPEELIGRYPDEFMTRASAKATRRAKVRLDKKASEAREPVHSVAVDLELLRKDGATFWAECHMTLLRDSEGRVIARVGVTRDVTARRRLQEQLRAQRERLETTLMSISEAVIATDVTKAVVFMNPIAARLTGWEMAHAKGRPIREILRVCDGYTRQEVPDPIEAALCRDYADREARGTVLLARDGRAVPVEIEAAPIRGRASVSEGVVLVLRDVSERLEAEARLWHQAFYDSLTELPNRALLCERLELTLAHARQMGGRAALLLFDLDNTKIVNDAFGYLAGDDLLAQLAHRLRGQLREFELLARLGGDEFALMIPTVGSIEEASSAARRLIGLISSPFSVRGHEVHVTTNVGISLYPEGGSDPESLLQHADAALNYAQETGKNMFQFHAPEMNIRLRERIGLENGLRAALEEGELVVYYQPIVNTLDGRVTGVEALVRWQHPEWGLLLPGQFLPVAEETGVIKAIDEFVLRQAFLQANRWEEAGYHGLEISVNLSAQHFHRDGLITMVKQALADALIDPKRVVLEITESTIMRNPRGSLRVMQQLKELGIRLALDDFGTGYSSLGALKQFPVDILKIDKTFVDGLALDPRDERMTETIIQLAHRLQMRTVAEGIESYAQWQLLRQQQCDAVQGYLVGRPVPANEITELVKRQLSASLKTAASGDLCEISKHHSPQLPVSQHSG